MFWPSSSKIGFKIEEFSRLLLFVSLCPPPLNREYYYSAQSPLVRGTCSRTQGISLMLIRDIRKIALLPESVLLYK